MANGGGATGAGPDLEKEALALFFSLSALVGHAIISYVVNFYAARATRRLLRARIAVRSTSHKSVSTKRKD